MPVIGITGDHIRAFDQIGAVPVHGLLSDDMLECLRAGVGQLIEAADDYSDYYSSGDLITTSPEAAQQKKKTGQTLTRQNGWVISAPLRRFLHESPLAGAAASLLKSREVRLYEDLMIWKAAGSEQPTPWHQDEPQWPLAGRQMCSAWFCLDAVDSATGALRFVSGTHKGPRYRPYVAPSRAADLQADSRYFDGGRMPDVDADPARFPVVCHDTQPGDVVFFHPRVLHGAFGSAPTFPRRTFSIRFLGDDVRWEPKKTVMYDWLARIELKTGDPVVDPHFPVLWPRQADAPIPRFS